MKIISIVTLLFCMFFINIEAATKYEVSIDPKLLNKSKEVLMEQVGVKEKTGHNDGKEVEYYLNTVGRQKGDAWCAALQYAVFYIACKILNLPLSFIPIERTGLANGIFNTAVEEGVAVSYKSKDNDLIVWRHGGTNRGHIERIIEVRGGGWVTTIGGNTSSAGSQDEGEGVYKKRRNIQHPLSRMMVRGLIGFRI